MSGLEIHNKLVNAGVKKSEDWPTTKTVNGKEVGDDCVCCGNYVEMGAWLCGICAHIIGHQAINDIVNNMPEYLAGNQYEMWLKLKLGKIRYENK